MCTNWLAAGRTADPKPALLRTSQLELPLAPMARPMQLDGHYAAAQLEKLDTFKGHTIPLSAMLAEYLRRSGSRFASAGKGHRG